MSRHAAIYLRRSSVSGDYPGEASYDAQESSARHLAAAHCADLPIVVYSERPMSGTKDDRPEYVRLKAAIAAGEVCGVFTYSLSRLGRSNREVLSFFDLCHAHDVQVVSQAEGVLSATSAFGTFSRGILAGLAQLESDLAKERGAAARAARAERRKAAGLTEAPPHVPPYGKRTVKRDGLWHLEDDPSQPIGPLLDAYRTAGSLRGAVGILNAAGIAPPQAARRAVKPRNPLLPPLVHRGGTWTISTLARILRNHDPAILPVVPKGKRAQPVPNALFGGLLWCHCGRRMTPAAKRRAYYCARGRDERPVGHGPYWVREADLCAIIEPETAKVEREAVLTFGDDAKVAAERARLERLLTLAEDAVLDGVRPERARARIRDLNVQLAALGERSRRVRLIRLETLPRWPKPDGSTPERVVPMRDHLRRLYGPEGIRLGADMRPTNAEWPEHPDDAPIETEWKVGERAMTEAQTTYEERQRVARALARAKRMPEDDDAMPF